MPCTVYRVPRAMFHWNLNKNISNNALKPKPYKLITLLLMGTFNSGKFFRCIERLMFLKVWRIFESFDRIFWMVDSFKQHNVMLFTYYLLKNLNKILRQSKFDVIAIILVPIFNWMFLTVSPSIQKPRNVFNIFFDKYKRLLNNRSI